MDEGEMEDTLTWNTLERAEERLVDEFVVNCLVRLVLELQRDQRAEPEPAERVITF